MKFSTEYCLPDNFKVVIENKLEMNNRPGQGRSTCFPIYNSFTAYYTELKRLFMNRDKWKSLLSKEICHYIDNMKERG